MIDRRIWIAFAAALLSGAAEPRAEPGRSFAGLAAEIARIEAMRGGRLGRAVLDSGTGQRMAHGGDERLPMAGTLKLLLAGAVLARVDAGTESLDRRIRFVREDLVTYSPVAERHVGDGLTVGELCEATATSSDNTAADLLLQGLNGPAGPTAWPRGLGDEVARLGRMEPALNEALPGDPRDTSSPTPSSPRCMR
jgi:beta-lactamase class A